METDRATRIAALNDAFRKSGTGGQIVVTAGVHAHGERFVGRVLEAVRSFSTFTADNDPHHEHDFGAFEIDGERLFWKIDYYDRSIIYGSENPADPDVTTRVLTIMLREEY